MVTGTIDYKELRKHLGRGSHQGDASTQDIISTEMGKAGRPGPHMVHSHTVRTFHSVHC